MAVTNAQIRDMLNRPRGLNEATITEYVTIRTAEVNKVARGSSYNVADNAVTDTLKESAIKALVCCDCLRVLVDTAPMYVPENEFRQQDIRFRSQLDTMQKQADNLLSMIAEKGGSAFHSTQTGSRLEVS
jgi:hypothetical protein|tara:strand:+ start:1225 stop:1614 length:390 start_codon:yes stop_codon:yes gene_type:complete